MAYKDIEKARACQRRYYQTHKEVYLHKNRRKKEMLRNIMRQHKAKPCADCGNEFPFYVMDFDHREGEKKNAHVSKLVQRMNLQQLLNEIAKCDVVCSNCHRIRTYQREQRYSGMV